jgi:acyl-CoA oxidase
MDAMGMINYVYENAKTAISEKNPIVTRKTDDSYLIDEEFLLHAFQYREKRLYVQQRIKLIDSGLDPYDVFNIVQHQMIDVAQAYPNELY